MEDEFHQTRLKQALLRLRKRWIKELAGERRLKLKTLPEFCLVWVLQHLTPSTTHAFGRVMLMFCRYVQTAIQRKVFTEQHAALVSVACTKFASLKFFRWTTTKLRRCLTEVYLGRDFERHRKALIYDRHIAVMTEYPEAIPLVRRLYPKCPHCAILSIYFPDNQ
jgi:hypothetical protein